MTNLNEHKILIVDDEPTFVEQFRHYLESQGFSVSSALGGHEALEWIKVNTAAVVVADERMPGMNGVELLKSIQEKYPDTIRVLITGYSDINVAIKAVNEGSIYRYLSKVLLPEEIALVMRQCQEKYFQDQEVKRLYRANKRLLRRLAAEENLSTVGIFGKEVSTKLEEIITGLSAYLFKQAGKGDPEVLKKDFQNLNVSIARIREIATLSEGIQTIAPNSLDLNQTVEEEIDLAKEIAQDGRMLIQAQLDLDSQIPQIALPRPYLKKLLKEIVENAVLFSPKESRELFIKTRVFLEKEDPRVEVNIQNNVACAPTVALQNYFAPFYTSLGSYLHSTGERGHGDKYYNFGLSNHYGIGLPIARWIASQLGGEVTLDYGDKKINTRVVIPLGNAESGRDLC